MTPPQESEDDMTCTVTSHTVQASSDDSEEAVANYHC